MCQDLCHLASFPFCSWETTDFSSLDVWNYIFIGKWMHYVSNIYFVQLFKIKSNFKTYFTIIIIKTNPAFWYLKISLWETYYVLSLVGSVLDQTFFYFRHRMRRSYETLHHQRFGRNLYVSHNFIFRHWPPRRNYYYPPHV